MIDFYLPDFYYFFSINTLLISYLHNEPEKFYSNVNIKSIYGCFPSQIWNGGRAVTGTPADINNIINTIKVINELGISVRFTYTNSLLTEEHLKDAQCNFITDCANNGMNEILVNSPILEEYLMKKYPNFKYISSTTKCVRDINKINELINSNKYSLVVGDYRDNFDFDFLNKIEQKDKYEILIDPWCDPECKIREYHYKVINQLQLGIKPDKYPECKWTSTPWHEILKLNRVIPREDLYTKYVNLGFKHFKLEGRCIHPSDVIDSYMYYLVKPEYRDEIKNILIKAHYPEIVY